MSDPSRTPRPRLRPLSLAQPRSSTLPTPSRTGSITSPLTSPPPSTARKTAKRMSSISYSPRRPDTPSDPDVLSLPPFKPKPLPSHSHRLGRDPPAHTPTILTLADKHADLLHYIAQKEARALELRTQLAAAERELAALKRKWEGIVARSQAGVGVEKEKEKRVGETLREGTRRIISVMVFDPPPPFAMGAAGRVARSSEESVEPGQVPTPLLDASPGSSTSSASSTSASTSGSTSTTPMSAAADMVPLTAGPTLHALTTAVNKRWDSLLSSEAYTASSKLLSSIPLSLPPLSSFTAPALTSTPAQKPRLKAKAKFPPPAPAPRPTHQELRPIEKASPLPSPSLQPSSSPSPSLLDSPLDLPDAGGQGANVLVPDSRPRPVAAAVLQEDAEEEDAWGW